MQGDKVSNETKEDEVARFGKELTSKIRLNDIKHPGTKFQQHFFVLGMLLIPPLGSPLVRKPAVSVVSLVRPRGTARFGRRSRNKSMRL